MKTNFRLLQALSNLQEQTKKESERLEEKQENLKEKQDDLLERQIKLEEEQKEIEKKQNKTIKETKEKVDNIKINMPKDGKDGRDGKDGKNGLNGHDGKDGTDGKDGRDGKDGKDGKNGQDGADGVGIYDIELDKEFHLIITLTDGRRIDCGYVRGQAGMNGYGIKGISVTNAEIRQGHLYITLSNGKEIDAGVVSGGGSGGEEVDPIFTASPAYNITSQDITNWNNKSDFSGDYNDLANKPSIPSKTSDLTNDSNFIDTSYHDNTKQDKIEDLTAIRTGANLGNTALQPNDNISELVNDAGYITSYTETDPVFSNSVASGITQADITNWNGKSTFSGDYNDLTNKPTIPTVPTNVSAFTNDAGYLTQHQDISGKYDKTGGEITGNVKIDGTLTLDIEDEDYDAGITFDKRLDDNLGTILTLTGYANGDSPTNYKPVIRNIATPHLDYDVANKKYVDDNVVVPTYHLVELNLDGSVNLKASTLTYQKVHANLSDPKEADYLDVFWENGQGSNTYTRFYANCVGISEVNNGNIMFTAQFYYLGIPVSLTFNLAPDDSLTTVAINVWERQENKVQSVVQNSTETDYYPSTKAVFDEFQRKPVVIWESSTPVNYLKGIQADISASPAWQLTNLDMTPFKRIKIYSCAGQKTGTTASASTTPGIVLELSLDSRAAISAYGGNYVGSVLVQKPNDANRYASLTCAVSADKTSFVVLRQSSLYGTAATSNNDVNANVFMIEGYYD